MSRVGTKHIVNINLFFIFYQKCTIALFVLFLTNISIYKQCLKNYKKRNKHQKRKKKDEKRTWKLILKGLVGKIEM